MSQIIVPLNLIFIFHRPTILLHTRVVVRYYATVRFAGGFVLRVGD